MSKGLSEAQEYLTALNRAIAKDESETHERIARCAGLDGDADFVSRREWQSHHDRTAPLKAEREAIIKLIVASAPMPTIVIPAARCAALASPVKGE